MASNVEDRIVRMQFDGSGFTAGAEKALETLAKLESALHLDGAANGLDDVKKNIGSFNMDNVSSSVETAKQSFSAFNSFVSGVFLGLGQKAVEYGEKLVRNIGHSLTKSAVDGFKEYEQQMKSVQTISANSGASLEQIEANLDELNEYADKTSYVFSDMTSAIGRFTAAGLDVDSSTKAIQGFFNAAALSGAGAQEASRGVYQLSQAMSAGVVKLQDWKSIENASIDTDKFRSIIMLTAEHLGVADEKFRKAAKGEISFRESLASGWLTADVMQEALENLTMSTMDYEDAADGADQLTKQLVENGYTEEQAKQIIAVATAADQSAREIRSWSQLMETMGESMGSGWAETWKLIIGNYEESKEFFTWLSDRFSAVVTASSDARNNLIKDWREAGGREALIGIVANTIEVISRIVTPIKDAFSDVFGVTGAQLAVFTENIAMFTERLVANADVMNTINLVFHSFSMIILGVIGIFRNLAGIAAFMFGALFKGLTDLYAFKGIGGVLGVVATVLNKLQVAFDGLYDSITQNQKLFHTLRSIGISINTVFGAIFFTMAQLVSTFYRLAEAIFNVTKPIQNLLVSVLMGAIRIVQKFFRTVATLSEHSSSVIWSFCKQFERAFTVIFELISNLSEIIGSVFSILGKKLAGVSLLAPIFGMFDGVGGWFSTIASNLIGLVSEVFESIINKIENFSVFLHNSVDTKFLSDWIDYLISVVRGPLSSALNFVKTPLSGIASLLSGPLSSGLTTVQKQLSKLKLKNIVPKSFVKALNSISKFAKGTIAKISSPLSKVASALKSVYSQVRQYVEASKWFNSIKEALSDFVGKDSFTFIEFLTRLKDSIVENFKKIRLAFEGFSFGSALSAIPAKFKELTSSISDKFPEFGGTLTDKISSIKDAFSGLFQSDTKGKLFGGALANLPETFRGLFDQIASTINYGSDNIKREASQLSFENVVKNAGLFAEGIAGLPAILSDIVDKISGIISEFLKAFQLPSVEELLSGGVVVTFIGFARSLTKVNTSLSNIISGFVAWPDKLGNALKQIGAGFNEWRKETKADALLKISFGIAVLAGSLFLLASIPSDDLIRAGKAMGIIAGAVVGILTVFALIDKLPFVKNDTTAKMLALGTAIQGFGIGVAAFAAACLIISAIPMENLDKSIDTVTTIAITLAIMAAAIGEKGKSVSKGAKGFVIMAGGIWLMAKAIESIGNMDTAAIEKAMPTFLKVMAALTIFGAFGAKGIAEILKVMPKFALGVLLLGASFVVLAAAIGMANVYLQELSAGEMIKTFAILGASLLAFVVVCKVLQNADPISAAAGILVFSVAMGVLAMSVLLISSIKNFESTIEVLGTLGLLIGEFAIIANGFDSNELMATGLALILFASSIAIMAYAMNSISSVENIEQAMNGLKAMALLMAEFAIITKLAGGFSMLMAGAALVLFSASIIVLSAALKSFESVNPKAIAPMITAVAVSFAAFGVLALILSPLAPVLLTVSSAMLVFAAAVFVISASIGILTASLLALDGYDAETIASKLGGLGTGLGSMLLNMFRDAFTSVYNWLVSNRVELAKYVVGFLNGALEKFSEFGKWIVENAPGWFTNFVQTVQQHGPEIASGLQSALGTAIQTLGPIVEQFGKLAMEAKDRFLAYITSEEFRQKASDIRDTILEELGKLKDRAAEAITNAIQAMIDAINNKIGELTSAAGGMVDGFLEQVRNFFGEQSPSKEMEQIGDYAVQGLINGMDNRNTDLGSSAGNIFSIVKNALVGLPDLLGNQASTALQWFIGKFAGGSQSVSKESANLKASATNGLTGLDADMSRTSGAAVSGMVKQIASGSLLMSKAVGAIVASVKNAAKSLAPALKQEAAAAVNGFCSVINAGRGSAHNAASGLVSSAASVTGSLYWKFYSIGQNAVRGLVDGINSLIGLARARAAELMHIAQKAAEAKAKVKSPSRVWRQIGQYLGEGLVLGMGDTIGDVRSMGEGLADAIPEGFSDSISSLSLDVEDLIDTDYNPVIEPVIDPTRFNYDLSNLSSTLNGSIADNMSLGSLNYNGELIGRFDDFASSNNDALRQLAENSIDYDLLGAGVANALIRAGVRVEMDGGQLMGYLAGEIADTRRMYRS